MTILPGLTTTDATAYPQFIHDLDASPVREIALFPTALETEQRWELYKELERITGLSIPHVHLRVGCDAEEIAYLMERFGTQVFNIHPLQSRYPFGEIPDGLEARFFVENAEVPVTTDDLERTGGICPDYSHLESARVRGDMEYVTQTEAQLASARIGCCHVSAIRPGTKNAWNGGPDHHRMESVSDLDYMARYADRLPERWISLELENGLQEQLEAASYLHHVVAKARA